MEEPVFLIKQLLHEDICYTKGKGANFHHRPWRTKGKTVQPSFWKTSSIRFSRTRFAFSQARKISAGIRWWTHITIVKLLCPHTMNWYWWKTLSIDLVFGVVTSDSDVMLSFIFPHGFRLNTEAYIMCLEEMVLTWIERVAAEKRLTTGLCTIPHKQESAVLTVRKFLRPHPP